MKKKIVVLLMASTLALSACGSQETAQTTEPTTTVEATTVTAEADETTVEADETTVEDDETTVDGETTEADDAETTEVGESVDVDLSALQSMDMEAMLELAGVTIEKVGGNVTMTYPAEYFAGMEKEEIEEALTTDTTGSVVVNDDGSVVFELTEADYATMEEAYNEAMGSITE